MLNLKIDARIASKVRFEVKIFVLGSVGSCKTPFSKMIGERLGINQVISVSNWLNTLHNDSKLLNKQERFQVLTDLTIHELRKDKDSCVNYIKQNFSLSEPCIIEGLVNPNDFIQLFEPTKDIAIFLTREDNPYTTNFYEKGIILISHFVDWIAQTSLLDLEKRLNFMFKSENILDVVDNFVKLYEYKGWCKFCSSGANSCSCNKK